jgi:hypothetical protein
MLNTAHGGTMLLCAVNNVLQSYKCHIPMTQIFINTALGTLDLVCLKHLAVLIYIWFNDRKLSNVQNFLPGKVQIFIILYSTSLPEKFFYTEDNSKQNPHIL